MKSDQRSFATGDVEFLEAIDVDEAGEYSGPVWVFERDGN